MSRVSSTSSTKRKRDAGPKFYAVRIGKIPGIYHTWNECQAQVNGHRGASFKSFPSLHEAQAFVNGHDSSSSTGKSKFYAVASGKVPGIYTDWPSAQAQTMNSASPRYKSFATRAEAELWLKETSMPGDPSVIFPDDESPLPGITTSTQDNAPVAKKPKITKTKTTIPAMTGPGYDALDPDAEDGFDSKIIMDPVSGDIRYKTAAELNAKKRVSSADQAGQSLHIYTDGSCRGNGQPGSVAGVGVWFGNGDPRELARNISEPLVGRQTNNRAELTALKRALTVAPLNRPVTIHSDSQYAINCVTTWYLGWRSSGWKTSGKKDVENRDLIEDILEMVDNRFKCGSKTHFAYVKAHAGNEGNEAADRLANSGAAKTRINGHGHAEEPSDLYSDYDEYEDFEEAREDLST